MFILANFYLTIQNQVPTTSTKIQGKQDLQFLLSDHLFIAKIK